MILSCNLVEFGLNYDKISASFLNDFREADFFNFAADNILVIYDEYRIQF